MKVRQLVEERGSPLAWETQKLVDQVEYAGLLPRTMQGAIRRTWAACIRDSDLHALETMTECVMSLTLFRYSVEGMPDRRDVVLRDLGGAIADLTHLTRFFERVSLERDRQSPEEAAARAVAKPFGPKVQTVIEELQAAVAAIPAS